MLPAQEKKRCHKTQYCSICHKRKPFESFGLSNRTKNGRRPDCKSCRNARDRKRYQKPEGLCAHKNAYLKHKYGITLNQYNDMLEKQGGGCKICGQKPNGRMFPVDHDHKTGKVRHILCPECNHGIGNFKDNVSLLLRAIEYLQESKN